MAGDQQALAQQSAKQHRVIVVMLIAITTSMANLIFHNIRMMIIIKIIVSIDISIVMAN